jgi:hypothetical protein
MGCALWHVDGLDGMGVSLKRCLLTWSRVWSTWGWMKLFVDGIWNAQSGFPVCVAGFGDGLGSMSRMSYVVSFDGVYPSPG